MIAVGTLEESATGMVTGTLWKALALVLLILMLGACARWRLAAHDLEQVRAKLVTERAASETLHSAVREQNRAVAALAMATRQAEARGLVAQQLGTAARRRYDGALGQITGAQATTCDEAMPAVNALLEAIR